MKITIAFFIGTLVPTFLMYALVGWILRIKKNKNFVLVGMITWLLSAVLYGFGSLGGLDIEYHPYTFFEGLTSYSAASVVWTIVAIIRDKKKVSANSDKPEEPVKEDTPSQ